MPDHSSHTGAGTTGQVAYETYAQLLQTQWPMAVWQGLSPLERYGWEAAAQAVLDHAPGSGSRAGQGQVLPTREEETS